MMALPKRLRKAPNIMLSLSTSWNHSASLDMRQWLESVRSIGFNTIELGYTLTHQQVDQIVASLDPLGMHVSSIHNFSPIPYDEPSPRHPSNHYRLSSLDPREQKKAIEWTKYTIDLAVHVKAKVVVIHAGTLELDKDPSKRMLELYKAKKSHAPEFAADKALLLKLRENNKKPYLEVLKASLSEVVDYAAAKKVVIGLETRYYPIEIPNFDEIGYFLELFHKKGMSYWHDVGHAEIQERLGLAVHDEYFKKYQKYLIGVHIHGIREIRDHLIPFDGDMDLERFLPYFSADIIKVVESRTGTLDQLKNSRQKLLDLLPK